VIILTIVILILFIEGIIKFMAFPAAIALVLFAGYKALKHKNSPRD